MRLQHIRSHTVLQAWQSPGANEMDASSERVKFEVAQSYQMARDAHQHLKLAHQQLQARRKRSHPHSEHSQSMRVGYLVLTLRPCALQEERISATKARKAGEIALKAAEQVREKAQGSAQQLKEGSEQRLVKQLAAQRYVSP